MELENLKSWIAKKLTGYSYDVERAEAGDKRYTPTSGDLGRIAILLDIANLMNWGEIIPDCFVGCNTSTMTIKNRKR